MREYFVPDEKIITFSNTINTIFIVAIVWGVSYLRNVIEWFSWGHVYLTLFTLAYIAINIHLHAIRIGMTFMVNENNREIEELREEIRDNRGYE